MIESCVGNWKKTAWKRLDVEEIEQQCKRFNKDIRSLGKSIRSWQPFVYIEKVLKNLVTSLRAITELQNTAIKDRHWLELMKSTGVNEIQSYPLHPMIYTYIYLVFVVILSLQLFSKFGMIYLVINLRTHIMIHKDKPFIKLICIC